MTNPFKRATIGQTSAAVTRLGLGSAPLGGWPEAITAEQARATVEHAWERGVRYFDTAPYYGHGAAEEHIGHVLSQRPREEFTLSTKVGRVLEPGAPVDSLYQGARPFTPVFDFSENGIRRSLRDSRERLGFEPSDIALIHDPDDHHAEALAESYPVLAELRDRGELKAVGAGMNFSAPLAHFAEEADFDCFLLAGRYTLLEQDSLDDLMPVAAARGISIIIGGVFNSGLLIDPSPGAMYDYAPAGERVLARAQAIADVCEAHEVPLRAAALQFPFAHPAVTSVLVGARSPAEIDDAIAMLERPIPAELWEALQERELLRADAPTP